MAKNDRAKLIEETKSYLKTAPMAKYYIENTGDSHAMRELASRVLNQRSWVYSESDFKNFDDVVAVVTSAIDK
jgi:hypothetical protein